MTSLLEMPQVGQSQSSTLGNNLDGDYDLGGFDDVEFSQFLNDFDFYGNPLNEPNTDPVLQNMISPIAPANTDSEDGKPPAILEIKDDLMAPIVAGCRKSDPVSTALTYKDLTTPAIEPLIEKATSTPMATRTNCATTPDNLLPDYQSPPLEDTSFFPDATPVSWSPTTDLQPRFDSFSPVSAPPLDMYDPYNQVPLEPQYDQSFELSAYKYPPPPSLMDDQRGTYFNAVGPYGPSTANIAAQASHPCQQTSISYPGSPTQPYNRALMMCGCHGPPGMLRQVRQYHPSPSSDTYNAAAMFNHGQSSVSKNKKRQPLTSNPRKRATLTYNDTELLDTKRQRFQDWVANTNAAQGLSRRRQRRRISLQAHSTTQSARSMLASIGSPSSEVDTTKAVTLDTRRNRNPGRKSTIPQTAGVLRRNRIRRERYRESLPPQKRKMYDLNASIAKGLIAVPSDEAAEEDTVHDATSEKLTSDTEDGDGSEHSLYLP